MFTLIQKTNIDFIGKRYLAFAISSLLLLSGTISILKKGFKFGIDFTGGSLVEVRFQNPISLEELRKTLREKGIEQNEIQTVTGANSFIIRTLSQEKEEMGKQIQTILAEAYPQNFPLLLRAEYVGPAIGKHLIRQARWAIFLSLCGIVLYVAFRFHSLIWGSAGIIALAHDIWATLGIFSILDKEISLTVVAAILTLAGYSINDTIVIFDRMREKLRLLRTETLSKIINESINETLSRTIITSLTVFLVLIALFFFGGEVIHDFSFCLLFGVIVGSYSTIAVAAPLVYEWEQIQSRKIENVKKNKKI